MKSFHVALAARAAAMALGAPKYTRKGDTQMNSRHRFGILLAAAVVLASCYETATPLINGTIAQWPLGDGITYTKRDSAGTLAPVSGRLWRDGDTYLILDDGSTEDPGRIRFHALRDNLFVAQRDNGGRYNYDLVRVEADAVYAYGLRCDPAEDALFIASGVMTVSTDVDVTCTPNSLDTLQAVFEAKSGSAPGTIYTRTGTTTTGPAPVRNVKPGAEARIAFGQTLQGEIGPGDALRDGKYVDAYRFTGTAGQRITIEMPGDVLDTYLVLFSANDTVNVLASDDDSAGNLDARITYTLPQSGDYVIHATSAFAGGTGNYQLSLHATPGNVTTIGGAPFLEVPGVVEFQQPAQSTQAAFMPDGGDLTYGQTVTGRLDANSNSIDGQYNAYFSFEGRAGDDVEIRMNSDDFDAYLFLTRPLTDDERLLPPSERLEQMGDWTIEDDDGGEGLNSLIRTVLSVSGEYTITASTAFAGGMGDFELSLTRFGGSGAAAGGGNVVDGIDFGADSSTWANDGECDDPRFQGPGVASILVDADLRADATDCLNAYRAGRATLR